MYGIDNTVSIDLPVRVQDYEGKVEKISKRCIYTSIPDRGVMQLHAAWALIARDVPDASLVITSDWRLWDAEIDKSVIHPYQLAYARQPNVSYMGAIKRDKLIGIQLEADVHLYPAIYEELFAISVAESQVAGAVPITSQTGAIKTTNSFGIQIQGSPYEPAFIETFVKAAIDTLNDPYLRDIQEDMKTRAKERFSLDRILTEWEEKIFS
jgi:glycosyltransferase involved in cell wall biosynthesis